MEEVGSPRDYTCVDVVLYEGRLGFGLVKRLKESKQDCQKERVRFWIQGNYEKIRSDRVGQTYLVSGKELRKRDLCRSNSGACERVLVLG